jgi:hypothetical protein
MSPVPAHPVLTTADPVRHAAPEVRVRAGVCVVAGACGYSKRAATPQSRHASENQSGTRKDQENVGNGDDGQAVPAGRRVDRAVVSPPSRCAYKW